MRELALVLAVLLSLVWPSASVASQGSAAPAASPAPAAPRPVSEAPFFALREKDRTFDYRLEASWKVPEASPGRVDKTIRLQIRTVEPLGDAALVEIVNPMRADELTPSGECTPDLYRALQAGTSGWFLVSSEGVYGFGATKPRKRAIKKRLRSDPDWPASVPTTPVVCRSEGTDTLDDGGPVIMEKGRVGWAEVAGRRASCTCQEFDDGMMIFTEARTCFDPTLGLFHVTGKQGAHDDMMCEHAFSLTLSRVGISNPHRE